MSNCTEIGERIKKLREDKGLTQSDLAKLLHVNREVVTRWETGDRDLKTEYTIKLADVLGTNCDYLLRGIDTAYLNIYNELPLSDKAIYNIIKSFCAYDETTIEKQNKDYLVSFKKNVHVMEFTMKSFICFFENDYIPEFIDGIFQWFFQAYTFNSEFQNPLSARRCGLQYMEIGLYEIFIEFKNTMFSIFDEKYIEYQEKLKSDNIEGQNGDDNKA